ncbi:DUF6328 family protein [Arthrobacter castelli]|uniref:DUF6328 family protein n=1 Tax=Arthrobacter castelli TaxID=271431 RepID=UPI00040E3E30|nr:DUF6328 family protein [Arthrobacter castelli]
MGNPEVEDRQLDELTSELRTIVPGVTVLFAFLLTLPFSSGFSQLNERDRAVYMVSLISAACSLVLLLGESAYHRLRGKPYDKKQLIITATRQAVAALLLLMISLTSCVWYVTQVVFPGRLAISTAGGLLVLTIATWFVLPLLRRRRNR